MPQCTPRCNSFDPYDLFQIILSLPVSFLIYRKIYSIPFLTELHILTIFIILGIGADDVFVFVDGWRQADNEVQAHGTLPGDVRKLQCCKRENLRSKFLIIFVGLVLIIYLLRTTICIVG